jgi:LytS/YehU family sensor histidine kinase
MLRAVLRGRPVRFASEKLEIVELPAIEYERFQERLTVSIDVPRELRQARIPPLLLQPLVENAVKHGITPMRNGGTITVRGNASHPRSPPVLRLSVIDTGLGRP